MTDKPTPDERPDDFRQAVTLREYEFTSAVPLVGGLVARLRDAWNSVATKWQARPFMEQQSAFNRALVDWLERPTGAAELDDRLIELDRAQMATVRNVGRLAARAAVLGGDMRAGEDAQRRPRIAYFSPLPPARSGIADYSAALLPALAELAEIVVFADDPAAVAAADLPIRATADFKAARHDFDLPLYQMGNSAHHEMMYELMLRYPGVVVLHDYFLHHFLFHHTAAASDWTAYARELSYESGGGRGMARAIRSGAAAAPLFELPMNRRIIDTALGLIVHSRYAADLARQTRPDLSLAVVPAMIELRPGRSRREALNLPDDALLFASFGFITPEKRVDEALDAFRQLLATRENCHFLLVGEAHPSVDVTTLAAAPELAGHVHHIGYVNDLDAFADWIHTADVVVNLRRPTVGETSAVALRAMAAARPLIVYDHGWYAELPDAAALKVAPDDAGALPAAMARLADDAALRQEMGAAGRDYARNQCSPPVVARAYLDFIYNALQWGER